MKTNRLSNAVLRGALIVGTFAYAAALHYAHVVYLNPLWAYFGFTYRPLGIREICLGTALLLIGSLSVPSEVDRPSAVLLLCVYIAVYVPAVTITLSLDADRIAKYGWTLGSLAVVFMIASIASRAPSPRLVRTRLPDETLSFALLAMWAACAVILITVYHSIMSLVSLADVYQQRAAGASTGWFVGYVQTYFSYVVSTALVAVGLSKSRSAWVILGMLGCLIQYMIDAERTVFLLPAAILVLHFALRRRSRIWRSTAAVTFALAAIISVSASLYRRSNLARIGCEYLTYRSLAFPGLTLPLYYDLFSRDGFTWFSHVKGLNAIVKVPPSYANDPNWPRLGYIVADRIYHVVSNANANLFADGIAAGGVFGVFIIGLLFTVYIVAIDWAARRWDRNFVLLLLLPLGITFMNGPFFTAMLSYGGLFWFGILSTIRPQGHGSMFLRNAKRIRTAAPVGTGLRGTTRIVGGSMSVKIRTR